MSEKLELCPFCGGEAKIASKTYRRAPKYHWFWVECVKCKAEGKHCKTEAEAIAAWNNRMTDNNNEICKLCKWWVKEECTTPKACDLNYSEFMPAEQPKCKTCGGIRPLARYYYCKQCKKDVSEDHLITINRGQCKDRCPICKNVVVKKPPCPDCADQPKTSEFTKKMHTQFASLEKHADTDIDYVLSALYEACKRLDHVEADNKILHKRLSDLAAKGMEERGFTPVKPEENKDDL